MRADPLIRGQLLVARLEHLREAYGALAIPNVLAQLRDEDAALLRDVNRERWYAFGLLHRLDEAIARELAPGDPQVFEQLGWASARHRTEWLGEHAALVSVHAFLSRVADEHHRFQTFGQAHYRRTGFHEGELRFSDYPEVYPSFCASARGYFLGVLQLLTGHPGSVEETGCQCRQDPACTFVLRWQRGPAGAPR
jgi:predicted hydrocarbon binding protein